jgi:hypothetical protein
MNKITTAYGDMINGYMEDGWKSYLLTFMFNHLRGSPAGVQMQMEREVERVYAKMLTRVVRKPRSLANVGKLPIWIAVPDFPVPKRERTSLDAVTVNNGRHVHALALDPPWSRMGMGLDEHFQQHQELYLGAARKLRRIDVELIRHSPKYVTDYALKSLKRRRADGDDVLILPRALNELREERSMSQGREPQVG